MSTGSATSDKIGELPKMSIEKLTSDNFYLWSNKIEILLRGQGLWGFVEGTDTVPTLSETADSTTRETYRRTLQKRDLALSLILLSIDNDCMSSLLCVYVTSIGHDTHTQRRAHLKYVNGWSLRATRAVWLKDQTQSATWRLALRRPKKYFFCDKRCGNEHWGVVVDFL